MGYDEDTGDGFGYISWKTCLRLRDYRLKGPQMALLREGRRGEPFALIITEFGKQFYCENWQHYHHMYPDIDAPEPHAPHS